MKTSQTPFITQFLQENAPTILLTVLLGVGQHFLFTLWPSIITEFIAPVTESIWEHVKLVYWPLLLVFSLKYGRRELARWLLSIVITAVVLLLTGWTYHVVLGGTSLAVDGLIYLACIALAFCLAEWLNVGKEHTAVAIGLMLVLGGLIAAFTLMPPPGTLFNDPRLADAWVLLPC